MFIIFTVLTSSCFAMETKILRQICDSDKNTSMLACMSYIEGYQQGMNLQAALVRQHNVISTFAWGYEDDFKTIGKIMEAFSQYNYEDSERNMIAVGPLTKALRERGYIKLIKVK